MKIVGLTGGIGSGKTTVAGMFYDLGIAAYSADDEAKKLMEDSPEIKNGIVSLFGEEAVRFGEINRAYIAQKAFEDPSLLEQLNGIIHPRVAEHFDQWIQNQNGTYVIKETAILYESGTDKGCDKVIVVAAPEQLKIDRVMRRSQMSEEGIRARMANQWPDEQKIPLADWVIVNDGKRDETRHQVGEIHKELLIQFR